MQRWFGVVLAAVLLMLAGCAVETPTEVGQSTSAPGSTQTESVPTEGVPSESTSDDPTAPTPTSDSDAPATPLPADQTAPPADGSWTLTTAGFGPIVLGEPVPEDLHSRFDEAWECFGPTLFDADNGAVEVWTEDTTVATSVIAIVMVNERARTREGAWIGMTRDDLAAMYPELSEVDSADAATTLDVLTTNDGDHGLFFELEADTVVGISLQAVEDFTPTSDRVCG